MGEGEGGVGVGAVSMADSVAAGVTTEPERAAANVGVGVWGVGVGIGVWAVTVVVGVAAGSVVGTAGSPIPAQAARASATKMARMRILRTVHAFPMTDRRGPPLRLAAGKIDLGHLGGIGSGAV